MNKTGLSEYCLGREDMIAVHDGGGPSAEWEAEPRPGGGLGLVR
jgi:hypothetical protein